MSEDEFPKNVYALSLSDIASWQFQNLWGKTRKPAIVARVPSLQRGAVWKPEQIELFWDSILRGFPVGSLVVCNKLDKQLEKDPSVSNSGAEDFEHHLLDGQQRGNAIALGFADPFDGSTKDTACLWIDLNPEIPRGSTRSYLIRLTTQSHPWGYNKEDATGRLKASEVREALVDYGWRSSTEVTSKRLEDGKPKPREVWPYKAETPVPLSWLMDEALNVKNEADFWKNIKDRCLKKCEEQNDKIKDNYWAIKALNFVCESSLKREQIFKAVMRAMELRIIALEVPEEAIMSVSEQEKNIVEGAAIENSAQNISNVEHLFQRLNSGGTQLDGEELSYSMIKAYWPELEKPTEDVSKKYMAASRLVTLGARVALASPEHPRPEKLPGSLSVGALRAIARENTKKRQEEQTQIKNFFGQKEDDDLGKVCALIDYWFIGDISSTDRSVAGDYYLPPVLRTSIAQGSPDVYVFLMWVARRYLSENSHELNKAKKASLPFGKYFTGLATALHWFGIDKVRTVNHLLDKRFRDGAIDINSFKGILKEIVSLDDGISYVTEIIPPDILAKYLTLPTSGSRVTISNWRWYKWNNTNANNKPNPVSLVSKILYNKELLLYAQRRYLLSERRLKDYDPARQDLWKDHNRPWDYDHILAAATVYNKRGMEYKPVCDEWINTIGNYRAWPFEDNRSDQDTKANDKVLPLELDHSLILDLEELNKFSCTRIDLDNSYKVHAFISAARDRLLRIYADWYKSLDIDIFCQ